MSIPNPAASVPTNLSLINELVENSVPTAETPLFAEHYRQIFVSLDLPDEPGPVIGITSAIGGEGRSTVALGLAQTLAADLDTMTLLVDADFSGPSLHTKLGISASRGLADVLRGEFLLEDVTYEVSERLLVVPSGDPGDDSPRLLRLLAESDVFAWVREQGGTTILDLPPLLNNTYSSIAASAVDAVVLVVRAGVTPAEVVSEAIARSRVVPQGAVLNGQQTARPPWPSRRR